MKTEKKLNFHFCWILDRTCFISFFPACLWIIKLLSLEVDVRHQVFSANLSTLFLALIFISQANRCAAAFHFYRLANWSCRFVISVKSWVSSALSSDFFISDSRCEEKENINHRSTNHRGRLHQVWTQKCETLW